MRTIFFLTLLIFMPTAFAGISAFSGSAGDQVFIEESSDLGPNKFLIRFTGVPSPWANKAILTKKEISGRSEKYVFDYDEEFSSGIKKRTFALLVETGRGLVEGSLVKKVELFYDGMPDKRVGRPFLFDKNLTDKSQSISLVSEYKKSPFKPSVE